MFGIVVPYWWKTLLQYSAYDESLNKSLERVSGQLRDFLLSEFVAGGRYSDKLQV